MIDPLERALALPQGARFYRCALQVNPYGYVVRHSKPGATFPTEAAYNVAMIAACKEHGVDVIAITDHYRDQESVGLAQAARNAGVSVVPAFEAVTKDGVHVLCFFPLEREVGTLGSYIGECGIHGDDGPSPTGKLDFTELLDKAKEWGALCVPAHVASDGGLLQKIDKQPRVKAWRHEGLLAVALAGPISTAPTNLRPILENTNPDYKRDRPVSIINAQDVSAPDDLAKPSSTCWLKMSEVSLEGLRQAFLDAPSRVRLNSDSDPEPHSELVAIAWEGGPFLDGMGIHFNENLNVLIGGRGAGKSTVVESIRYVLALEPIGDEARRAHQGIVKDVLRSGTKVSLLVRTHRPATAEYRVERTVPNPPVVRDSNGQILPLSPADVVPHIEVYGQHEISELAKDRFKQTRLLERFATRDPSLGTRKQELVHELRKSREALVEIMREERAIGERLDALPALEQTLRAYQDAGIEERLKERSLLLREERVLKTVSERLSPIEELSERLRQLRPLDRAFLSERALEGLPGKGILREADAVLEHIDAELGRHLASIGAAVEQAKAGLVGVCAKWDVRSKDVLASYERTLRELQTSKVDGEEFIRLRRQIEDLRPLKERQAALAHERQEQEQRRRNLTDEWENAKASEFRELERASKKVRGALLGRVDVVVSYGKNREPLRELFTSEIRGRLQESLNVLCAQDPLPLPELVAAMRSGRDALIGKFGLTPAQADRIAEASPDLIMKVEELEFSTMTEIKLNVATPDAPEWRSLEKLSTGQKATAVLLLLLLGSDAPLVVDQPEDDLDNRFVTESIVPKLASQKKLRQFVFATHNANVPVLGDAELIVGLKATGDGRDGHVVLDPKYMASIDAAPVRELVEEVLEGGRAAFETRRLKYNF